MLSIIARIIMSGAIVGLGYLGLKKANDMGEIKLFNNGVCYKCGGHFEFKTEVTGSRAYKCDFCSNSVLLSKTSIVDKNYEYKPSEISKK